MRILFTESSKIQKGFTLIELLVVVAIIGILAAVGTVAYQGYTSSAKKNVVKRMHSETVKFIKAEIQKCDLGESEVMGGNLKCNERHTVNKIGIAAQNAFRDKFLNPFTSYKENVVALNGPHANQSCNIDHNSGGVMVSNIRVSSRTLVRVSTCYGETTALYNEFYIE